MAIKFQYNKTFLQQLNKGLQVRENSLPTLVAKESALRAEVKKAKEEALEIQRQIEEQYADQASMEPLWFEMPEDIVEVSQIDVDNRKIAGVATPVLRSVEFIISRYSFFSEPAWMPAGIEILKALVEMKIRLDLANKKMAILEFARKKTTQKVNLYEKVQIPEYSEAINKIKRFLEDEENLSKSSQKILKTRMSEAEAAL
jgi:V/A-type H+-transporting ATPase subunit D